MHGASLDSIRRKTPVAAVGAVLALAAPAPAATTACEAPPGTSGIDQYCEQLPTPRGDRPPGASDRRRPPVPRGTERALEQRGEDGAAILGLTAFGSAPDSASRGRDSKRDPTATAGQTATSDEPSSNPLSAITSAIRDGAVLGAGFVWALLALTLALAGAAWVEYRRRADQGDE
jgi:hypothetical protein